MTEETWRELFEGRYSTEYPDWVNGDAARFGFRLRSADLSGGATLTFAESGVTAIVGSNNVGKSTLLRELVNALSQNPQAGDISERLIVERLHLEREGTPADLFAWLGTHAELRPINPSQYGFARMGSSLTYVLEIANMWQEGLEGAAGLGQFLAFYADGLSRLNMATGVEMRDDVATPPAHPLHRLEDDPGLMQAFDDICAEVFGQHLELDRLGRVRKLRVGRMQTEAPPVNAVTAEYRAEMAALPLLEQQGDGMRSLLGLVMPLLTSAFPVVVIDEPEAFLHPPQAHALGKVLGRMAKERQLQVILSTHDKNLLAGLLDSEAGVSVARLERDGDVAGIAQLDSAVLGQLWTDPVLKHTNVLDGLFHRLVVLCEGDGDCQYFATGLDLRAEPTLIPRSEILFAPTNGKAASAKVAAMLRSVAVPVVCSLDLDLLDDPTLLRRVVEALGGEWTDFAALHARSVANFTGASSGATCAQVLSGIAAILTEKGDAPYDGDVRETVRAQLRATNPWELVKTAGLAAFKGDCWPAADELLTKLDELGVVLVREGVLERLAPETGVAKGSAWLVAALESRAPANDATQAHLSRILGSGPAVCAS